MKRSAYRTALLAAVLTTACTQQGVSPNKSNYEKIVESADISSDNWQLNGRIYQDTHHSPLADINTDNINQLGLSWHIDLPRDGGQQATPIVVDGTMYVTATWSVVRAINAATGEVLWTYDPEVPKEVLINACCGPVNRGVDYWDQSVIISTLDGRLISLDAKTGALNWSVMTLDGSSGNYAITGAPRVANGKVFIGNGGAEFGVRGYVTAYEIQSGKQMWRFYTIPGNPAEPFENPILEKAATTWHGEWWRYGGGGTVWDAMAFDPETNFLYIGVGNAGPYDPRVRTNSEGDNLFISSIVAVNADTGEYAWHYQTTPQDAWDFTATQNMIFAELDVGGRQRKVIMQAPKNGFFYVLDRLTGELLSAEKTDPAVNWASHVDMKSGRPVVSDRAKYWINGGAQGIVPARYGTHNWQPMAYSPDTGYVYIPMNITPSNFKGTAPEDFEFGSVGRNTAMAIEPSRLPTDPKVLALIKKQLVGKLVAWDPVKQEPAWTVNYPSPANGGVLATGGNLVFQGTDKGSFVAYTADKGEKLWDFDAQTSVNAAPITYRAQGEQYVAVMAGRGGIFGRVSGPVADANAINRSRLLVFGLGANKQLQTPDEPVLSLPDYSGIELDADRVASGSAHYGHLCLACHGASAVGPSVAPDLRFSGIVGSDQAFKQVVLDGILKSRGMGSFSPVLSAGEAEDIRQYIISQNHEARRYGNTERLGR